jgi:hypothetical protein
VEANTLGEILMLVRLSVDGKMDERSEIVLIESILDLPVSVWDAELLDRDELVDRIACIIGDVVAVNDGVDGFELCNLTETAMQIVDFLEGAISQ